MRYLPHTDDEIGEMLHVVGKESLDDLFASLPEECRRKLPLKIQDPLTEWELNDHMGSIAGEIAVAPDYRIYLGAGIYEHYIPESVSYVLGRSEFVTSYTPYQPEVSQGTLQAIFEYQTLICKLLGMEVANASMYDGASALAEAVLMAIRISGKSRVVLSRAINPLYRKVVRTYLSPTGYEIVELPYQANGKTDLSSVEGLTDIAAVAVQSPNFFGCIEDLKSASDIAHAQGSLSIAVFSEPLAYGLLKNPGTQGADIACGEGQSLGIPRSFGGPGLGILAARNKHVRNMPGRLVGQTKDLEGRRGFVLTLATREQHIRREKATSNICTNHSLCALNAVMYLASLGGTGLRDLAALNRDKAEYLKNELAAAGFRPTFDSPSFNEFVIELPSSVYRRLLDKKIVAGLPLGPYYSELDGRSLLCVTEVKSKEQMDALVKEMRS
jgi:glycine dehydrogenase subunit 1